MATTTVRSLPGAGICAWVVSFLRALQVRRFFLTLTGVETVVLNGRTYAVRPRPLGVCRKLVPAIIRCSKGFARFDIDDALYTDLVTVLSLGLDVSPKTIERLSVSPWDLVPVVEAIARLNGLPVLEAGRSNLGEALRALNLTGTSSTPESSAPPVGHGTTSTAS